MNLRSFLFSDKPPQKYYRHIAFWICTYIPFFLMGLISVYSKHPSGDLSTFLLLQYFRLPNILIDILFTYTVAYRFLPKFRINNDKWKLVMQISLAVLLVFVVKNILWHAGKDFRYTDKLLVSSWSLMMNFFNDGSLMRCGLFLGCMMLKNYYLKSEEKLSLLKENATAELQLLKAQVHPHFLFNTLNNIYSFSLNRSPQAASLVLKLSDTLRYMISECEAPLVPITKELKMLQYYIGLESVRYGTRLVVETNTKGDTKHKMMAPLLLIPLLENSFKHGTSRMLERPWIRVNIDVRESELIFHLANSKPSDPDVNSRANGIGLKNVEKRLRLLYPGNHDLVIENEVNHFEVLLRVPIYNLRNTPAANDTGNHPLIYSYDNSGQ